MALHARADGCEDVSRIAIAVSSLLAALALTGCPKSDEGPSAVARCIGATASWCSDSWSKPYLRVLASGGFDEFVARCPGGEASFYDRGSTRLAGKYDWYCASRANYMRLPGRREPLTLMGFFLAGSPEDSVGNARWAPGAFSQRVQFRGDFYSLEDGQCFVDFADHKVGGGVFRSGLAQEEKLFLQLPELLIVVRERIDAGRPLYLSSDNDGRHRNSDVLVFKDAVRPAAPLPKSIDLQCGWPPESAWPCAGFAGRAGQAASPKVTVVAVNAQEFEQDGFYSSTEFSYLARKILGAFAAAGQAGCGSLNSGPLGAGVFNGNVDLAVALHAVMAVAFDMPVTMWGIESASTEVATIVGWIEGGSPKAISQVLHKLQLGVSWGHGRNQKTLVGLDRSRWDAA